MLFVKPEDPIVADLLHSFARLEETANNPEAIATLPSDKFDTRPLAWGAVVVIIAVGLFLRYRME